MMKVISVGYVDIKQKLCLLQKCRLKKIPVSAKVDPVLKNLLLTSVQYVPGTEFLPVRLMSQSHNGSFFQPCLETFIPETRKPSLTNYTNAPTIYSFVSSFWNARLFPSYTNYEYTQYTHVFFATSRGTPNESSPYSIFYLVNMLVKKIINKIEFINEGTPAPYGTTIPVNSYSCCHEYFR
jgi:hypothetical protein